MSDAPLHAKPNGSLAVAPARPLAEVSLEDVRAPDPQPSPRVVRYNLLFEQGRCEEALEGFMRLLSEPGGHPMHANVGYCLRALERYEEAVEHFEAYLEELPFKHHAWKALSYCFYKLKDYEGMTKSAREAIKWDIQKDTPDDYPWQQLATAHFLLGDLSTSLKAARKARELNPRNAFAAYYEACVLYAVAEGAPFDEPERLPEELRAKALTCLTSALELMPSLEADALSEGHVTALMGELTEVKKLT